MLPSLELRPLTSLTESIEDLRDEAARQGFGFLDRLVHEWTNGTNRFDRAGEQLLGAFVGAQLVGVGGVNREPYDPAPRRARLRHVYVLQDFRRRGVARLLVSRLVLDAAGTFEEVRLRTNAVEAAILYEALGFEPTALPTATHTKRLVRSPNSASMSAMGGQRTFASYPRRRSQ